MLYDITRFPFSLETSRMLVSERWYDEEISDGERKQ